MATGPQTQLVRAVATTHTAELLLWGRRFTTDEAAALGRERETVSMLFGTADRVEGVRAFLEKRAPTFQRR